MARQARLVAPGHPHHVLQRGNNRGLIVHDDVDRKHYLQVLGDVAIEHRVSIHAYVLMDNHVHLLVSPSTEQGLSRMMQSLGRRYVGWFNHRHGRTGTLWEGRFRAQVIDADGWLLSCLKYIELNPHRAGLASGLLDWPWSSLSHHIGERRDPLITDHPAFWQLGNTPFERDINYRRWLEEGLSDTDRQHITSSLMKGATLGSEAFVQQVGVLTQRDLSPRPRGRPRKLPTTDSVPN